MVLSHRDDLSEADMAAKNWKAERTVSEDGRIGFVYGRIIQKLESMIGSPQSKQSSNSHSENQFLHIQVMSKQSSVHRKLHKSIRWYRVRWCLWKPNPSLEIQRHNQFFRSDGAVVSICMPWCLFVCKCGSLLLLMSRQKEWKGQFEKLLAEGCHFVGSEGHFQCRGTVDTSQFMRMILQHSKLLEISLGSWTL